jgi:hypothetical protein
MAARRDGDGMDQRIRQRIRAAGERARKEAEERRKAAKGAPPPAPETGGRGGPEPARYGDWEVKGIASDF